MSDEYTLPVNDDIYITGETEEVVPDFSEIDDDDSTQETVTRTPAVISSDNRSSIGSGELNPSPSDVVPADVATSDVIVTQRVRHQIDDYEPAALKALSDAGAVFYGVYADGHEEGPVSWTEVHDLDPEGTIIELDEEIASAIAQNFWADTQGVHITDDPYNEWIEAYESNPQFPNLSTSKNYYNILLNAGGALLRRALNNLVSINRTAISFYDGLGNASTNIMAFFGRNGAQIGRSDEKHVVINSSGIGSYNGDGTVADFTMRGSSIVNSTISGSALVDNTITGGKIANATITGAKIDSGTITNANIANGTITGAKIDSGTITNANIADGTIQGSKIQGSTLTDIPFAAITDAEVEVASIADAQIATATITEAQVENLTTDYAHLQNGVIDNATINHADVNGLSTTYATISNLNAATARIGDLEADHVSVDDFEAEQANIDSLQAATADIATIRADSAKVHSLTAAQLSAATAYIAALNADNITAASLSADVGKIHNLTANEISAAAAYIAALNADSVTAQNIIAMNGDFATVKANAAKVANLTAAQLEADHATVGSLDANYAQINMANVNNAWIANGTIKDGAISSAMINDVSANKLTAGTINGSVINVTNLNADNITTGTINGQRIGEGSLSLSKLEDDVYTEAEVDAKLSTMQSQIDGAIETWTGTAVPTLQNSPASSWSTTALKDSHVGDVYFVVNSQSQQNGYNYRFTKSGSTYSWQLIKDSDVTNALQRLTTAEGKISTFDTDISQLKTDTGTLTTKTTSLETRMSDAEADILDKVDTTTFNEVSDTVDQHSQTISQHTTAISNKADSSTVTAVTNRVSKNEQDISGINTTIGTLQTTVESKADGSTVETMSTKLNTVSDTVDGHTQSISSITSTQTTMQGKLDKTLVETTQLWFSKADTTAPNKPTTQVTSTTTTGNAWTTVVPAYNASYPNYYYCYQWKYSDGTYGWSAVTRDIAMGESQERARTAITNAATADTKAGNAATAASNAQSTANKNVKSSTQLWYTKANDTAPAKPTSKITSTAVSGDGWRVVVPTYSASYPYYFYCWQYELADGTCTWSDVIYDRATTENQSNSRNAVTGVSTLTTKTNNIQDTVDGHTSQLSSITSTQTTIQGSAVKSTVQLWFTKADTTAPAKPTAHVTTNNAATGNAWNLAVPTYNASYPNYYYCYEYQYLNDTYGWSAVTRDIAMSETSRSNEYTYSNNGAGTGFAKLCNITCNHSYSNLPLSFDIKSRGRNVTSVNWNFVNSSGVDPDVFRATYSGDTKLYYIKVGEGSYDVYFQLSEAYDIIQVLNYQNPYTRYSGTYITVTWDGEYYGTTASDTWTEFTKLVGDTSKASVDADISTAQTSANNAQATADKNVKESQQLWFTKANGSAPAKPTSKVTSTSTNGNAWTTKVPTYNASYPHYFYCMQYIAADGTVTWSDVVYDQATTEAQSVARTTSTNLSMLQSDYATFKQTTQNFESTIGTTYATKTELQTTDNKIENLEIGGRNLLANTSNEAIAYTSTSGFFDFPLTDWGKANIKTNDSLTLSFDAYSSTSHWIDFYWRSASTSYNSDVYFYPAFQVDDSTSHYTISSESGFDIDDSGILYLRLRNNSSRHGGSAALDVTISNLKLEKGTKPTDWTPAPEDVDAAIDKVDSKTSVRLHLRRDNWSDANWGAYASVGHADNFANAHVASGGTSSATGFDATTLNIGDLIVIEGISTGTSIPYSATAKVTSVPTSATGNIPATVVSANNAKAIESRVSSAETSITQNTEQIALRAKSSDVYTKTQTDGLISTEASNRNSAIEQSANAINLSVSQTYTTKTEFNALEVGGRNFLLNTENPTSSKPPKPIGDGITWGGVTNVTLSFTDGVMKLTSTSTSGEHYVRLNTPSHTQRVFEGMGVDVHDKLVLSGFIRASISAADGYVTVRSQTSTGSNWTNQITLKNLVTGVESTGSSVATILDGSSSEWVRFAVLIFIPESVTAVNEYFSFQQYGTFTVGDTFELKRLKLERGNKATDWSPAPEDMVTTTAFESAKSEIQQTTDGITSTVSKISSAKYLETSYQYTLAGCLSYAAEGYSGSWTVTDTKDAKVGDTVYLKVKDTTRNCFIYIKGTVTNVNGNAVRCTSHGYEDVLPVNTIKSTINQSSDSVKIEARHVNIEGAAIFSSGGRLSEESLNNTYDPKGAAQNAVSGAFDNRVSDSAEFLYRRTADGEDVPSGRATIQTIKGNTLRWNQLVNASMPIYVNSVFATREVNDGTVKATVNTVSLSASFYMLEMIYSSMNGHVLLCTADVKVTSSATSSTFSFGYESQGTVHTKVIPSGSWKHFATTLDVNMQSGASNYLYVYYDWTLNLSVGDTVELKNLNVFDLTQMFGAGNEPATVAEFEALYPKSYYPYDPGSLLPVRMEGVETVGFNQWDEEWEIGAINPATGENAASNNTIRAKHYITVFPKTVYYNTFGNGSDKTNFQTRFYDADKTYIGYTQKGNVSVGKNALFTTPENAHYMRFQVQSEYGTTYNHDICINISDPSRNGEYEPYWSSQCNIPTTELRSAGSVYDELQNSKRITRVGEVDLGTLTWVYDSTNAVFVNTSLDKANGQTNMACGSYSIDTAGIASMANMTMKGVAAGPNIYFKNTAYTDAATFKTAMSGVMLHYALATPATTPIDPPLNFVYKADASGTERILVDETKEAPQSSPVPMDITYGVNLYEDTIDDVLNISSRVSATEEAISPLASKTYTGIIGTANDANGASFYFGNVFPVEYDGIWKVHLRINVTEPVLYQQNIDIMISGHKSSYMSFDSVVSRSSSALAVYFINLYMATQTGINAGVGHALGFNLRASTNPTNTSYKRTISVDVLDVYNCSVKLFDTAVKYDNLPSYNTTNYGTHSTSASLTELSVSTNGQNASNNGNTYDRTYHNNPIKAATAITAGRIICGTSAGYKNIAAGTTFDISYPLLYSPNAIAVNSTRSDTYSLIPSINFSNNGTIQSGVAYAQLYLKGTIVGNTFTIAASPFMTTVVPATEDGYFYIPMGIMSSATAGYFESSTAIYAFLDGKFRQVTPTEIVASHRVYYRTGTVNNSLAAPTTWVAEATGDVYNAWTTKIPPLSSGVSSTTKYPYLYTCEQRKRLDGTVECTKVLLDDSNTIIDGGTIITGSIAANKLDVYDATIGKISTSAINLTGYAQTDDIPTKVSDLTNDTGFVTNDDIQIGGRNLLRNSKAEHSQSSSTSTWFEWPITEAPLDTSQDYTFSFDAKTSNGTDVFYVGFANGSAATQENMATGIKPTTTYTRMSVTARTTKTNIRSIIVSSTTSYGRGNGSNTGGTLYIKNVKLERSNKATDWSPAPEDVDADISSKADPEDIPTKVSDLTNDSGFQDSSQVETAITSKGYATQNSLNSEINQRKAQYGTCSTAAATQAKAVTCSNFELVAGKDITVKFTTANTYASGAVQLNVNSKGAKNVWVSNAVTSSSNQLLWGANAYITFRYDGTQFIVIGEPRTWYGASTTAEGTAAKTDTTAVTGCVICKGAKVELAMTNANTATAPTLNIQSTGAKNVYFGNGTARPTKADGTSWLATNTCTFTFDGQYWRTAGKTYIDANSIVTGYLSADRIEAGSLSANKISATSGTFDTANIPNLSSDKITVGGSTLTSNLSDKDSAIADAAKHTQVIISATNINYVANTCTLTARLYIDGVLQTSTSLKWQWYRDGTTQGSQTTGATGSLAVTSSLGLAHRYACKCTF